MKKNSLKYYLFLLFSTIIIDAKANDCQINQENSYIEFIGSHAGNIFKGRFTKFIGKIDFDFDNIKESQAKIEIKTKSAKTKSKEYNYTLKKQDWFNTDKYPEATYETSKISKIKEDYYDIEGYLTIRNIKLAHNFSGKIKQINNQAILEATSSINRLDFDIGTSSDPDASWVSKNINLNLKIDCLFL